MSGLNISMSIAVQALMAEQGALSATSNNIANVNTPGYSRQIPVFNESPTIQNGSFALGTGVTLEQFQGVRDQLLQLRIYEQTQQQSGSQAQLDAFQQLQVAFSSSTEGIGAAFSSFFNSLNQLSADPTNVAVRQQVLTAAGNLASTFHQATSSLNGIQAGLDQAVPQIVSQINQLTPQIAKLNAQVSEMNGLGQDAGSVQDQRDELIRQLSTLTNISVTQSEHGLTISTGAGSPLVVGNHSYDLQAGSGASGVQEVFSQGQNISSTIQGGKLGGTLQVRDQVIPQVMTQLDTLATDFTSAFNTAHQGGFDLNGNSGQDFFTPLAAGPGAASNFGVAITDPKLIAASSDGSAGSNGNILQLIGVRDKNLPSGSTPLDAYANVVLLVGNLAATAQSDASAGDLSLQQLNDQRSAVSGVSIDEESTNMLRYQQAYGAAARVITTVDQMMQTLLAMAPPA